MRSILFDRDVDDMHEAVRRLKDAAPMMFAEVSMHRLRSMCTNIYTSHILVV